MLNTQRWVNGFLLSEGVCLLFVVCCWRKVGRGTAVDRGGKVRVPLRFRAVGWSFIRLSKADALWEGEVLESSNRRFCR